MTTGAVVMCDVRPGLERVALEADAASSSTGTGEAARSSDGVDMDSTSSLQLYREAVATEPQKGDFSLGKE